MGATRAKHWVGHPLRWGLLHIDSTSFSPVMRHVVDHEARATGLHLLWDIHVHTPKLKLEVPHFDVAPFRDHVLISGPIWGAGVERPMSARGARGGGQSIKTAEAE